MSAEILPCPVCGKPCRLTAALVGTSFYVLCGTECAYSGTRGNLIDATIAAHNAIASAVADRDRLAAENERLKAVGTDMYGLLAAHGGHPIFGQAEVLIRWAALAATATVEVTP